MEPQAAAAAVARQPNHVAALALMWVWCLPQIVAAVFGAAAGEPPCSRAVRGWVIFHGSVLVAHLFVNTALFPFRDRAPSPTTLVMNRLLQVKFCVDAAALFSFCFGAAAVLGDSNCEAVAPRLTTIARWLFVAAACRTFLPCIVLVLAVAALCCCLPCIVRWVERAQDPNRGKGATQAEIDRIGTETWQPETAAAAAAASAAAAGQDVETGEGTASACSVCILDFEAGDEIRRLPCQHCFHTECIDSWLRVNATCPTCRAVVVETPGILAAQAREQQALARAVERAGLPVDTHGSRNAALERDIQALAGAFPDPRQPGAHAHAHMPRPPALARERPALTRRAGHTYEAVGTGDTAV